MWGEDSHHTRRVQAASPGAVQPGQEEAQLRPPHSAAAFSNREHRCGLIPEEKTEPELEEGLGQRSYTEAKIS